MKQNNCFVFHRQYCLFTLPIMLFELLCCVRKDTQNKLVFLACEVTEICGEYCSFQVHMSAASMELLMFIVLCSLLLSLTCTILLHSKPIHLIFSHSRRQFGYPNKTIIVIRCFLIMYAVLKFDWHWRGIFSFCVLIYHAKFTNKWLLTGNDRMAEMSMLYSVTVIFHIEAHLKKTDNFAWRLISTFCFCYFLDVCYFLDIL